MREMLRDDGGRRGASRILFSLSNSLHVVVAQLAGKQEGPSGVGVVLAAPFFAFQFAPRSFPDLTKTLPPKPLASSENREKAKEHDHLRKLTADASTIFFLSSFFHARRRY